MVPKYDRKLPEENTNAEMLLLIVEDNEDLRFFLADLFKAKYKVVTAVNGKEGLEVVNKNTPDIVISDVMMPIMDGFEMCQHLKGNLKTSHIPIILLTVHTSLEEKYCGLKNGADLYVSKPFNNSMLQIQVHNLLTTRKHVIQKIQNEHRLIPDDMLKNELDRSFVQKIREAVKEHASDGKFGVQELAKLLGMNRRSLHHKLHTLTGYTPSKYIRKIRVKKAKEILVETNEPISDVAFHAGFYNSSHLSKIWKEEYHLTPKEFRSKNAKHT